MGKIRLLDQCVINKIAAGEVIENPSCVLKELVENSIDANASRINVDIHQSGMGIIRVADDGEGMSREDAILAVERHATSKLESDKDLYSLKTLGFRGEALPSIASVSKFLLRTVTHNDPIGTRISIEGGKLLDVTDDTIAPGTIIEIKTLFYNVPARKKFIRSFYAEKLTVTQTFLKIVLAYPEITFVLNDDGKEIYHLTAGTNKLDRVAKIFGHDFIADLIPVSKESPDVTFHGYVSHPQLCRNTRSGQYLYVNRRAVQSYQLSQAVQHAYGSLLPAGRFPIFFLYLDIDPGRIDVNVHPTKREVKFSELSKIEDHIQHAVEDVLKKSNLVFDIKEQTDELKKINLSYNIPRFSSVTGEKQDEAKTPGFFGKEEKMSERPASRNSAEDIKTGNSVSSVSDTDDDFMQHLDAIIKNDEIKESQETVLTEHAELTEPTDVSGIRVLGQIGKCFILGESNEGLVIIDQHAAHERINYEKIINSMRTNKVDSQSLLFPVVYQSDQIRKKFILSKLELLRKAGIGICEFGNDSFMIDALPQYISASSITAVLEDLIEESQKSSSGSIDNWQDKLAKMMACRNSVKSADKLSVQELQQLLEDLHKTEVPYTCPHGRPTIIKMTYEQLRHYFKRE